MIVQKNSPVKTPQARQTDAMSGRRHATGTAHATDPAHGATRDAAGPAHDRRQAARGRHGRQTRRAAQPVTWQARHAAGTARGRHGAACAKAVPCAGYSSPSHGKRQRAFSAMASLRKCGYTQVCRNGERRCTRSRHAKCIRQTHSAGVLSHAPAGAAAASGTKTSARRCDHTALLTAQVPQRYRDKRIP